MFKIQEMQRKPGLSSVLKELAIQWGDRKRTFMTNNVMVAGRNKMLSSGKVMRCCGHRD